MRDGDRHLCLKRCLGILKMIASNRFGTTIEEMAKSIGVGKRTVFRYLNAIQKCGIRVHSQGGGNGLPKKWRLTDDREHLARIGIL